MPSSYRLSDCVIKDASKTEIFFVQDGPAFESAKRVRDRLTHAVLPVDAAIVAIKGSRLDKVLDDELVKSIIAALGVGIQLPGHRADLRLFDITKLRYGKLIIATKPTPTGRYIRDQIVTLLFRFSRPLFDGGYVYLCGLGKGPSMNDADFESRVLTPATRILIPVRPGRSIKETIRKLNESG